MGGWLSGSSSCVVVEYHSDKPHDLDKVPEKAINAMVVDEETEELLAQQVEHLTCAQSSPGLASYETWTVEGQ